MVALTSLSIVLLILIFLPGSLLHAQLLGGQKKVKNPVTWEINASKKSVTIGESIEVIIKAKIKKGWHIYTDKEMEAGPYITSFDFQFNDIKLKNSIKPLEEEKKYDSIFGGYLYTMKGIGEFIQKVVITGNKPEIKAIVDYAVCENNGSCLPPNDTTLILSDLKVTKGSNQKTSINKEKGKKSPSSNNEKSKVPDSASTKDKSRVKNDEDTTEKNLEGSTNNELGMGSTSKKTSEFDLTTAGKTKSLWGFFVVAFVAGLGALLTPCVFPLIPMTVTFFLNSSQEVSCLEKQK